MHTHAGYFFFPRTRKEKKKHSKRVPSKTPHFSLRIKSAAFFLTFRSIFTARKKRVTANGVFFNLIFIYFIIFYDCRERSFLLSRATVGTCGKLCFMIFHTNTFLLQIQLVSVLDPTSTLVFFSANVEGGSGKGCSFVNCLVIQVGGEFCGEILI